MQQNLRKMYTLSSNLINVKRNCEYFKDLIRVQGDEGNVEFVKRMKDFEHEFKTKRINLGKIASKAHAIGLLKMFEDREFEFVKLWRQHFVDSMSPRYLPQYWSVDSTFFDCVYDR